MSITHKINSIIVTGANGQLGREIRDLEKAYPSIRFYFFSREELNIGDDAQVEKIFTEIQPRFCVNCAAYTAVDKAESETEKAFLINALGAQNLAESSSKHNTRFIHISTDYVFDGNASEPYKEDHPTNPMGVYGASKLEGERLSLEAAPDCIIIRTSWVYSVYGNNFVKTMLRLLHAKPELNVVADQLGTPTYAHDLANAIMHIITTNNWVAGIYHFSNEGITTWFEFAKEIGSLSNADCIVHPIATSQYPTAAQRPQYSVISKEKIKSIYDLNLLDWKESLSNCIERMPAP